ncbi:putative Cytochrome P450 [Seiridium cardinale]
MALLDGLSAIVNTHFSIVAILLGLCLLYTVASTKKVLTGPLSSLPGPFLSRWTDLHVRLILVFGKRAQYVHWLHKKYGPVVRVGPDTVDVSDGEAALSIHRAKGGFAKSSFYDTGGRVQSMFSTRDRKFHANRRRLLGPCFTEASLNTMQPIIDDLARLAIENMRQEAGSSAGSVDVLKWWTLFAMDTIGQLSIGESFGMVESGVKNEFAEDISNAGSVLPLRTAFPTLIWIGNYLPLPFFRNIALSRQRIVAHMSQRTAAYLKLMKEDTDKGKGTIFSSLVRGNSAELTPLDLTIESLSYITAGTDTTAVTLAYLIWAVCRDPGIKERLVRELQPLPESPTYKDVKNLPYLNCVIQEALRRYGAAPGALPRDVPKEGLTVGSHHIPGGVVVSTQGYSLHRDSKIFPDPEKFNPSRWEHPTQEATDSLMAFGTGPRGCIGVHLAKMELRLVTALFFKNFPGAKVSKQGGMSDADMDEMTSFLLMPRGHRCLIELI